MAIIDLDVASSPFVLPQLWDSITVGDKTWGVSQATPLGRKVVINGAKRSYKWDIKDAACIEGATETYRGKTPPPFSIDFYMFTQEETTEWESFSKAFQYFGVKFRPKPVTIYHPALATLGITQVLCEDVGALEKVSDDLLFRATVNLREFFQPIPVLPTSPDAAANGTPADQDEDPRVLILQGKIDVSMKRDIAAGLLDPVNPQQLPVRKPPFLPGS